MKVTLCFLEGEDVRAVAQLEMEACPRIGEEIAHYLPHEGGGVRWRVTHVQHMASLPTRLFIEPWKDGE